MGKGDKKSKRGKIRLGSSGVSRPRKKKKTEIVSEKKVTEKVKKSSEPKSEKSKAEKPKTAKKTPSKKKENEAEA